MSRVALGGTAVSAGMVTRRSGSLAVPISVVFVNIVPPTAQANHRRRPDQLRRRSPVLGLIDFGGRVEGTPAR